MSEKIAIDVVLLFPKEINDICLKFNSGSDKKDYISFEDGYNPHLTLGMGSVLSSDLENFKKELGEALKDFSTPEIKIVGLGTGKYDYFSVEMNNSLQEIHNTVFDLITKYTAGPVSTENFYEAAGSNSLISWVNNFKENSAYAKYHPHITLGVRIEKIPLEHPIVFKPVAVGLFHLGRHGTCKKLLADFKF